MNERSCAHGNASESHPLPHRHLRLGLPSLERCLLPSGPAPGLPCPSWVTSDAVYLRFHGSGLVYGGRYGREGLRSWADRIRQWLAGGCTIYAYFNNDAFGYAVEDAQALLDLLDT
jgi:uncharacterized protein YecE (DUF72 family)